MLKVLENFPQMLTDALKFLPNMKITGNFENVVVLGMGGSGFNGDLLEVFLSDVPVPIHVVKDYSLPKFVDRKSLIFAISYSGNTEETISAYRLAIKRGCKAITVSAGGKLKELSELNETPHISIPPGIQPRLSTPYLFVALLNTLAMAGLIDSQEKNILKCAEDLKNSKKRIEESAKNLSEKIKGKVPIIYSSQKMFCIAEKWKTDINENAKTHAFYNMFSEFNHNEICSYENPVGDFYVIIVSDEKDHDRIKKRIEIFKKLLKDYKTPVTEIAITGTNYLTRLFTSIWMGLYLGYYLAEQYGIDPTPVKIIEKLKQDLK